MAYCPQCKQAFPDDVTECPDDKVALVEELPYQTIEGPSSTWVEIASASTEDEAKLLQGFLEGQGIPCQVESLKFTMEPVNLGTMGEIRVYVNSENADAARELLDERSREYEELPQEESVVTDEGPAEIADDTIAEPDTEEQP
ncbi:MAG: putative signal transducing protein [Thermoanaerobaculia bacterium]